MNDYSGRIPIDLNIGISLYINNENLNMSEKNNDE